MNFKTYTSRMINPVRKSILLKDIYPEKDERGIIEGIVDKRMGNEERINPAVDALVSLYKVSLDEGHQPIYHTYTDAQGRFLFPVVDTKHGYVIKVFYHSKAEEQAYRPYESKILTVEGGKILTVSCQLDRETRKILVGEVMDRTQHPRRDVPVELYLTVGVNKIPVVELGRTRTDRQGNFNFSISSGGNYRIRIYI